MILICYRLVLLCVSWSFIYLLRSIYTHMNAMMRKPCNQKISLHLLWLVSYHQKEVKTSPLAVTLTKLHVREHFVGGCERCLCNQKILNTTKNNYLPIKCYCDFYPLTCIFRIMLYKFFLHEVNLPDMLKKKSVGRNCAIITIKNLMGEFQQNYTKFPLHWKQ